MTDVAQLPPIEYGQVVRVAGDVVSAGAILGTLMGYLPALAALGAIVWYAIQIWESKTVQTRVRAWRLARRRKRLMGKREVQVQGYTRGAPPHHRRVKHHRKARQANGNE